MNHLVAHFRAQLWSMHDDHLRNLDARAASIADLLKAGLSPAEKARAGYNGGTTVVPEIDGDTATIEFFGDVVARAPWWAKAYLGVIDPLEVANAIDELAANDAIKRVIVEADSCGGTVAGAQECADAISRLRAAGKTVEVRVVGALCSAAMWSLCMADRIIATPTSLIGSNGVLMCLVDVSAAMAQMGVRYEIVRSGPEKALGADGKITDESKAEAQRIVNASAAVFFATLAAGRQLAGKRLAAVTTGAVWLAAEAKTLGLIDAVGSAADEVEQADGNDPAPQPVPPALVDDDADDGDAPEAAAQPPAADPPHQPAAAGASQESAMDANTKAALAALSQTHPTLAAALVAEAMKPDATADKLNAFASAEVAKATAAEADKLKADLAAEKARADKAEADKAKAEGERDALKSHGTDSHRDPGVGQAPDGSVAGEKTAAELDKMTPTAKAEFFAAGGKVKRA